MKKRIAVIIIIILLAGAAAWALYHFVFSKGQDAGQDKIYVQRVGSLQSYGGYANRYSGVVDTQKSEKIEFNTEYKLSELLVKEGDHVKAGDPLFTYDTEGISLEIDQLKLEIQKLNQEAANNNTFIEELTRQMNNSPESERLDYSTQIAELQTDNAQKQYDIKSKEAEIKKKEASIKNATVYATLEGTVKKIADLDAILAGTNIDSQGSMDSTYITITAEGDFRIKGSITETNIYEIQSGERVIVKSRINDDVWTGTISSIDTQTNESSEQEMYYDNGGDRATKYPFYVELDSTEGLMLGQHVTIEPDTGADITAEGIWLGSGFIVDAETSPCVWAAASEGASLEKRPVTLGRYVEATDQYEITSGLTRQEYIAWPDSYCREGAPTTSEFIVSEDAGESPEMSDDMLNETDDFDMEGDPAVDNDFEMEGGPDAADDFDTESDPELTDDLSGSGSGI